MSFTSTNKMISASRMAPSFRRRANRKLVVSQPSTSTLTDAVIVWEAFPRHTVAPQALVHVVAGLPILHPVIGCCGNDQEDVPHACTEQTSTHKAVHPAPADTQTHTEEQKVT